MAETNEMGKNVAAWLDGLENIVDTRAVAVAIGKSTWNGAEYTQRLIPPRGAANRRPYERKMIFLVGELPAGYGPNSGVCYTREDDVGRDWYVSGYWQGESHDRYGYTIDTAKYHPFGPHFQLQPWDVPDTRIDDHEPKPYKRLKMTVEYI